MLDVRVPTVSGGIDTANTSQNSSYLGTSFGQRVIEDSPLKLNAFNFHLLISNYYNHVTSLILQKLHFSFQTNGRLSLSR